MALKTRNKIDPGFSVASMADIIFLLLIFFMLTSQLVPKATVVEPPTSNVSTPESPDATITITSDVRYFVNSQPVGGLDGVRPALRVALLGKKEPTVLVVMDKSLDVQKLFDIYNISRDLKFRIAVSTQDED